MLCIGMAAPALFCWDAQPAVEQRLRTELARSPDSFDANFRLGEFYVQKGKISAAIPLLEKACRLRPDQDACGHDLALAYLETGKLGQARREIEARIARKDSADLRNLLGAVEEKAGRLREAALAYEAAARLDPSEKNLFDLGNFLVSHNAAGEALKVLQFAAERFPRSAQIKVATGVAHYALGSYADAVAALCEAIDLDPKDPRPMPFLEKMYNIAPGMEPEVARRMERFVALYPENASAQLFYGLGLLRLAEAGDTSVDLRLVEESLKKSARLNPLQAEPRYQLGVLFERQGRLEEAAHEFEAAARLKPDSDKTYYRLGRLYSRMGMGEKARQAMARYKELHKDPP